MAVLTSRNTNFRNIRKRYTVGGGEGDAKTDTLDEAKRVGMELAKLNLRRGRWSLMWVTIRIYKQDAPGSMFYKATGWKIYVPVAGSGRRYDTIVAELKRRHGVAPMVWTRK